MANLVYRGTVATRHEVNGRIYTAQPEVGALYVEDEDVKDLLALPGNDLLFENPDKPAKAAAKVVEAKADQPAKTEQK